MVAIGHFELQPASRVHRSVVFADSRIVRRWTARFLARGPFKDNDGGSLGGSARLLDTRVLCTDILSVKFNYVQTHAKFNRKLSGVRT